LLAVKPVTVAAALLRILKFGASLVADGSGKTEMDTEMVMLKAEVTALKFVVLCLIDALPEAQRAAVCRTIVSFATASDGHSADFPVFSTGEEATTQMNDSLNQIVGMVSQFQAIRLGSQAEGTPAG
jgi:hypothetical protein